MSGVLNTSSEGRAVRALSGGLASATSWRNGLRPSSFRGVPFYMDSAGGSGGRRKVVHEFSLRDTPYIEDLGQAANKYRIKAWTVGDSYLQNSRALISACQDYDTPAIFVHAWRGEIRCSASLIAWSENKDAGGYCEHDIEFLVDTGGLPSPTASVDTASTLLGGVASLGQVLIAAYQDASLVVQYPSLLLPLMGNLLGGVVAGLTGLPSSTIGSLLQGVGSILLAPGDDSATATAMQTVFQGAAANAITTLTPATQPDDPVMGILPDLAAVADLSGGLAALATWGNTLATPTGPVQAAQQQAVQALVQGSAIVGVLAVYASIDWPTSQAASAARTQVLTMIDSQLTLAAATGSDDLYLAWQAVSGQAMADLISRAQALPDLVSFTSLASLPSLLLAQTWYQDAGRAGQLALLNDVPDPMFMPFTGVRLSA
ncbi:DNA circularization N-terminal domain-containing protein [Rhodopila sp.]|uniref:DNA circularization N-terminal domain-containing protein n=1 Tax=Rhodopila sp. TaxID=2480087 RepID=UPI003D0E44BC